MGVKRVEKTFILSKIDPLKNRAVRNKFELKFAPSGNPAVTNYHCVTAGPENPFLQISAQTHFGFLYGSKGKLCPIDLKFGERVEDT